MTRRQPGCALVTAKDGVSTIDDTRPRSMKRTILEEGVEEEGLDIGLGDERLRDVLKEDGLDDAATAPHARNAGVVEIPALLLGGVTHEHEALGVGHDLRSVERLLEVVDELLFVAAERLLVGCSKDLARARTLALDSRQAAGEDGLTDEGDCESETNEIRKSDNENMAATYREHQCRAR